MTKKKTIKKNQSIKNYKNAKGPKFVTKFRVDKEFFRVAIFGSARIKPRDPEYKLVYKLAKHIGEANLDVVTGGGPGLMDAASKGHYYGSKKTNAKSIGLAIRLPHEQRLAYHLELVEEFTKFSKRLDTFMKLSNVVVVAPGGVGTLLEFTYIWQHIQVHKICDIPIILMGKLWKDLIKWLINDPLKRKLISKKDLDTLFFVNNCDEAMQIINQAKKIYDSGAKHICCNLDKEFESKLKIKNKFKKMMNKV